MNRYQSIISAIISAFCIFVLPYLQRHGIMIDEDTATTIIIYTIGGIAFLWSCWKNHNITEAANEAQALLEEIKNDSGESADGEIEDGEADEL